MAVVCIGTYLGILIFVVICPLRFEKRISISERHIRNGRNSNTDTPDLHICVPIHENLCLLLRCSAMHIHTLQNLHSVCLEYKSGTRIEYPSSDCGKLITYVGHCIVNIQPLLEK